MADTSVIRPAATSRETASSNTEPRPAATLDSWARLDWSDGVQIDQLDAFDKIQACTRNSTYEITILDGRNGDVLVVGGQFFPTATRVRLNGCTAGGSCLKWRGVYCGFRIELQAGSEVIVTTRVQSITKVRQKSAVH